MGLKRRILVLGSSATGGDWPPVRCVAKGLRNRGHELRCFADSAISAAGNTLDIPVITPATGREQAAYFLRWGNDLRAEESILDYLERDPILTGWSNEVLPEVRELAEQFQPDLIVSQLFCMELASRLSGQVRRPWCLVNPGVYFGPGARDIDLDYVGLDRTYFFRLFASLVETASLVLHGTDPVFDPPPAALLSHHRYVGPLLDDTTAPCPAYLEQTGPPWVLVTLSTYPQRGETALARSALHALSGHPVRVLLTIAEGHSRDELGPIPGNARVELFVPHSEVLRRACLSVSHAGHGIVIRSLYHGVPMVLVPWDRDQPGVAYRAAKVGAAEVVAREDFTDERLAQAVTKVLANQSYSQSAAGFARRLQSQNSVGTACVLVEQLLAPNSQA
jgi:UDP:flavonoid glycosyltransferase YjiC (YdhE family)